MIYTLIPLGNKGDKYVFTRHNAGRIVIDMIKDDIKKLASTEVIVLDTFMNETGPAVAEYLRYHEGREPVVIYDDKDLPFGTFRIAFDRGDGGHNGLKSIIESIGATDFIRIRVGIAPKDTDGREIIPPHGENVSDYVLGRMKEDEEESLRAMAPNVLGAIKTITEDGYQKAMERYNGK